MYYCYFVSKVSKINFICTYEISQKQNCTTCNYIPFISECLKNRAVFFFLIVISLPADHREMTEARPDSHIFAMQLFLYLLFDLHTRQLRSFFLPVQLISLSNQHHTKADGNTMARDQHKFLRLFQVCCFKREGECMHNAYYLSVVCTSLICGLYCLAPSVRRDNITCCTPSSLTCSSLQQTKDGNKSRSPSKSPCFSQ